jgi:hypothetical protein
MYEGLILVFLVVLVILAIRPKTALIIEKSGVYHATLAPELERVTYLIEQMAGTFFATGDIETCYFRMHDTSGDYLLAAGWRGGILYFQAILPAGDIDDRKIIEDFSTAVMSELPFAISVGREDILYLSTSVVIAAQQLHIVSEMVIDK